MPWPAFSELSFGFSFLREYERSYAPSGSFPAAPDFITQNDEASLGYDVEVALEGSAPVFFQFKRSFVVKSRLANEVQSGDFQAPILYRMHLHKAGNFRQHRALRRLERSGNNVFYVTSQIPDIDDLTAAYVANNVISQAAALFSPLEINLPNLTAHHHLCFRAMDNFAFVYSDEGRRFRRKHSSWQETVHQHLMPQRQSKEQNLKRLRKLSQRLARQYPEAARISNRFENPAIQVSILAFLALDTQLSFFK